MTNILLESILLVCGDPMTYETISWPEVSLDGGAFALYSTIQGTEQRIRILPDTNGCAPMHIRIHGCLTTSAQAPANAHEATNAPRTRTFVDWIQGPENPWTEGRAVYTPDLTSVISEVKSLLGWARGNPLLLLFKNMASSSILTELPGYAEYVARPTAPYKWLRTSYFRDEHDSLLVLE